MTALCLNIGTLLGMENNNRMLVPAKNRSKLTLYAMIKDDIPEEYNEYHVQEFIKFLARPKTEGEKMLEHWEKGVMRLVTDRDENINEFLKEKYPNFTLRYGNCHLMHIILNDHRFKNFEYLALHDTLVKTLEDNIEGFVKRFEAKQAEHKDKFEDNVLKIEGIQAEKETMEGTIKKQLYLKNA